MDETSAMIEDTFCRLRSRPGVAAVVLLSQDGRLIKSSLAKQELGDKYADIMAKLVAAVRFSLDALDEKTRDKPITFVRIRTVDQEFLIVPDGRFIFAVVQTPDSEDGSNMPLTAQKTGPSENVTKS